MGEYMKDYLTDSLSSWKTNVVADALSRKSDGLVAQLMIKEWSLPEQVARLIVEFRIERKRLCVCSLKV